MEEHAHLPTSEPEAEPGSALSPPAGVAPARIVARVVDPAVREDGRGDPVLILHTAEARARVVSSQGPDVRLRGDAVRERLLAKARAAAAAPRVVGPAEPDARADVEGVDAAAREGAAPGSLSPAPAGVARTRSDVPLPPSLEPTFEALGEAADDLDLIGAPERRRSPRPVAGAPVVTARAALLLGMAFGVTALGLLFALLVHFAPRPALDLVALAQRAPAPAVAAQQPPARAEEREPAEADEEQVVAAAPAPRRATPAPLPRVQHEPRRQLAAPWRIADTGKDPELRRVRGNVGAGPFLSALQTAGVSRGEAYRVYNAFRGVKNLNRTRPQDSFETLLDHKGHVLAFEYFTGEDQVYQAREGNEGRLAAQQLDLKIERQRAEGVIVVHGGFEASARRAGFEPGLSEVVNKALAGYTSTGDMKDGDVLAMVAQEVTVLGQFERYAGIEALEYRTRSSAPVRIYYHAVGRARAYVDGKGRTFGKSRWARPVAGAGVSSRFNPRRFHPVLKRIKPHNGTDFGAGVGTPILAAAAGVVTFVGPAGPNGKMIRLNHGGGYESGYSHLSRFAKGLHAGLRVEQKQVIGYVGSTGRSTGPHLHFSVKRARRFIDPESLNLDGLARIPAPDRQTFAVLRQRYDQLLDGLAAPGVRAPEVAAVVAANTSAPAANAASDTPASSVPPTASAPTASAPTASAPTASAPTTSAPTASAPTASAPKVSVPGAGSTAATSSAARSTAAATTAVPVAEKPAAGAAAGTRPIAAATPALVGPPSAHDSEAPADDPEPQDDAEE
ncbi:MAG: peptidoglycan DD-metalloendopeptidase family protein [Deltaproteobacteria bacterium]